MTKFVKNFLNDFEVVNKYYNYLVEQTKKKEFVGITNEWLIDNFYLLVEHKTNVIQNKKDINKRSKIFNNIYRLLRNISVTYNYNIDFSILICFTNSISGFSILKYIMNNVNGHLKILNNTITSSA